MNSNAAISALNKTALHRLCEDTGTYPTNCTGTLKTVAFHTTCRIVRRETSCLHFCLLVFFLPLFKPSDVALLSLHSLKKVRWTIERVDVETLGIDHGRVNDIFYSLSYHYFSRGSRCSYVFERNAV